MAQSMGVDTINFNEVGAATHFSGSAQSIQYQLPPAADVVHVCMLTLLMTAAAGGCVRRGASGAQHTNSLASHVPRSGRALAPAEAAELPLCTRVRGRFRRRSADRGFAQFASSCVFVASVEPPSASRRSAALHRGGRIPLPEDRHASHHVGAACRDRHRRHHRGESGAHAQSEQNSARRGNTVRSGAQQLAVHLGAMLRALAPHHAAAARMRRHCWALGAPLTTVRCFVLPLCAQS
jgi:hypothetical protein